ncbi:lipase domain-containing protein [Phthorimaea operculella]|nr:lipase domain-containing protein [Phthorimaea operculella]
MEKVFSTSINGLGRGDWERFGPFQLGLKLIKCDLDRSVNLDVSGIDVFFYDFPKNEMLVFPIENAARGILSYQNLDLSKRFIIYVGGFKSHIHKETEQQIRNTFLDFPNSYLIIFDHSAYTNSRRGNIKGYERAVKHVPYIGQAIGNFLSDLALGGVSPKSMHCIGHSLGSHILAHAGETVMSNTGSRIWRITGLDPAGPCFSNGDVRDQIRSGVADYVEVYHCNAGILGTENVLADIDFFVNKNGQTQPNCNTPLIPGFFDSPKAAKCNHRACIDIWTMTVKHKDWYPARRCNTYKEFKNGYCASNDIAIGGFWNPGNATGVFYFSTMDLKGLD